MSKHVVNIFFDSGAFTAWKQGTPIKVADYIAYLREYREFFDQIVSLDVIPGERGQMVHTVEAMEKSARESYDNHQRLKKAGINAIPIFHQYEDYRWLQRYRDDGETYIGLSPYLRANHREVHDFLNNCFARLTDSKGWPVVKTHGFGVTSFSAILRYPWYSVDSATWIIGPGYGVIKVPKPKLDFMTPDWDKPPVNIRYTFREGEGNESFEHLTAGGTDARKHSDYLNAYFKSIGLTSAQVRNDTTMRQKVTLNYYLGLSKHHEPKPFKPDIQGFVDDDNFTPAVGKGTKHHKKIIFATNLVALPRNIALTEAGARERLISYWLTRDVSRERFERYMRTGIQQDPPSKPPRPGTIGYDSFRKLRLAQRRENYRGDDYTSRVDQDET